jgi:hypothetical protein
MDNETRLHGRIGVGFTVGIMSLDGITIERTGDGCSQGGCSLGEDAPEFVLSECVFELTLLLDAALSWNFQAKSLEWPKDFSCVSQSLEGDEKLSGLMKTLWHVHIQRLMKWIATNHARLISHLRSISPDKSRRRPSMKRE